jgi:hypothetical protein
MELIDIKNYREREMELTYVIISIDFYNKNFYDKNYYGSRDYGWWLE